MSLLSAGKTKENNVAPDLVDVTTQFDKEISCIVADKRPRYIW